MFIINKTQGIIYQGSVSNFKYHGKGILQSQHPKQGFFYEGGFKEGKKHGKGFLKDNYGKIYIGDFVDDQKCGEGKEEVYKNSKKIEGKQRKLKLKNTYTG